MSKIPIAEQISLAREALSLIRSEMERETTADVRAGMVAVIGTLEFVRDHEPEIRKAMTLKKAKQEAMADPAVNRVLETFPGAEIEGVGEAD